jgi:hypothetical protein
MKPEDANNIQIRWRRYKSVHLLYDDCTIVHKGKKVILINLSRKDINAMI